MSDSAGSARARSLADDLRGRSDADLAALLAARPDLLHPVPSDLATLAARAGTGPSVARALDRLDRLTLQVVAVLAATGEPLATDDLPALVDPVAPPDLADAVRAAADRLWRLGLAWSDGRRLHLVRAAADAVGPYPCGLAPASTTTPRTAGYAEHPERLAAVLDQAPPASREVLDLLVAGPPVGHLARADRPTSEQSARTPVEWLLARDLLLPTGPDEVIVPRPVALHLRAGRLVPDPAHPPRRPAATAERDLDLVDRSAGQHALAAVRATADLLDGWALDPPRRLRGGGLAVRDLARAAVRLDTDEATAALWVELAHEAGLLTHDGEAAEAWVPTIGYDSWLDLAPAARWAVLAAVWLTTRRTPGLVGSRGERDLRINALAPEATRPAAAAVRRAVLEVLAELPPGSATSVGEVAAVLADRLPRLAGTERDLHVAATVREAEALGVTGWGALATPGRVLLAAPDRVGAPAPPGPRTRRTPAPPPDLVDAMAPLLPPPLDHVLLQADLTAVAPGPLRADLARELALAADVESTGGATVYRFGPDSVRRALDAGRDAAGLLDYLTAHSRTGVPQPLRYLVEDVARRHGALRVGLAASYVRSDDVAALSAALADRRSAGLGLVRLAPTVLAAAAPVPEVLGVLRELGLAPVAEAPDGSVLVRRPDARRTARPAAPVLLGGDPGVPDPALVNAAVRALRAGDRAATAPRLAGVAGPAGAAGSGAGRAPEPAGAVPRTAAAQTVALLRAAVEDGTAVWLGYADDSGSTTQRVVDPIRLSGGFLTAYDHRAGRVRTFAVARVTGAAMVPDGAGPATGPTSG